MAARSIPNTDALNIIEESINAGKTVRLKVRGNSMFPLLMDGFDHVILHPCNPAELRPGDIIFFRYKGRFLLHRIISVVQPADHPAGQPTGFSSIQSTDRPEDNPDKQFDNRAGGDSGLITTRGDALSKTETITFTDIIAIAEVPRHTFITRSYRRLVIFLRKGRGFFLRRFGYGYYSN